MLYADCAGASAVADLGPIDIGKARRTGQTVSPAEDSNGFPMAQFAPEINQPSSSNGATASAAASASSSMEAAGNGASISSAAEAADDEVGVVTACLTDFACSHFFSCLDCYSVMRWYRITQHRCCDRSRAKLAC